MYKLLEQTQLHHIIASNILYVVLIYFYSLKIYIADTVIETLPGINGSHDVVFHTSPLTKYMEIHRVEFQDARKITFQSQHNNTQPEVFEIDHAYCHNRTLCVIESCNLTSCIKMNQALDSTYSNEPMTQVSQVGH